MALNQLLTADKEQLAFLSSLRSCQMIQDLAPSTIDRVAKVIYSRGCTQSSHSRPD